MSYNFTDKDLKSEKSIEDYKRFSKEVLKNMEAVKKAYEQLTEFNNTASISSKIGTLTYNGSPRQGLSISARGDFYCADRLRQEIYASQRGKKLAVNIVYQEDTDSQYEPHTDVAIISFEYDPNTQDINLAEVLNTQELIEMRQGRASSPQDKKSQDIEDCGR